MEGLLSTGPTPSSLITLTYGIIHTWNSFDFTTALRHSQAPYWQITYISFLTLILVQSVFLKCFNKWTKAFSFNFLTHLNNCRDGSSLQMCCFTLGHCFWELCSFEVMLIETFIVLESSVHLNIETCSSKQIHILLQSFQTKMFLSGSLVSSLDSCSSI